MGFKGYLSLQLKLIWVELGWAGAKVDQQFETLLSENLVKFDKQITENIKLLLSVCEFVSVFVCEFVSEWNLFR